MIQPELLTRLRLLAEAYRLPVPALAERVTAAVPAAASQALPGQVEERLPDGRFRVLAAGRSFDLALPPSTRPGDRVRVPPDALPALAAPESDAEPGTVSPAGRFVAALAARGSPGERTPAAIGAPLPLLPDAPVDATVAAATLRELVALSGLFYESHQAEWVSGERALAQLRREPQARIRPPAPDAQPRNEAPAQIASPAAPAAPPASAEKAAPLAIHPDSTPLVQQQLNALEARHIVWNGQIWPGQPMRWEIEEADPEAAEAAAPGRVWRTRVELDLPRLGAVSALIALSDAGLSVRLRAEQAASRALLDQRTGELRASLVAAGLAVNAIAAPADERA